MTGTSAGPMTARGHRLEGQKMRKVLGGVYRAEAHAAGEGGKEERAVHDGENAGGDWRGSLLQDTALEPDTQIKAWAGGVRLYMT